MKKFFVSAAALLAAAAAANAQFTTTNAGPINSAAPAADVVNNGSFTFNYAGSAFRTGTIRFSGDLTTGGNGSFSNEARWRITNPAGITFDLAAQPGTAGATWLGTLNLGPNNFAIPGGTFSQASSSVGNWNFRAFESFDDGGPAGVDATWANVSFEFIAFVPPPAPSTIHNFGLLAQGPAQSAYTHSYAQASGNQISWVQFDWNPAAGDQLVIDTLGTNIPTGTSGAFLNDTEIGLYNSDGDLITSNDDSTGLGAGQGTSRIIRNPGSLPAGTYYVGISTFNSTFAGAFGVANTSVYTGTQGQGTVQVNITVPAPSSLALVGFGGLLAARRRRA